MTNRGLLILPLAVLVACSAATQPAATPPPLPPPPASAPPVVSAEPPPAASTPPGPELALPAASAAPSGSAVGAVVAPKNDACPSGMKLVEGDYCTEAEQKCLKKWYDKSNKKEICEEFEAPSKCIGKKIPKRYCIDEYSWPNVKGERPEVMNNFYQAQVKCASIGRRMCTESEWTLACEGPEIKPFPYGFKRDPTKCNGDHMWDDPNMKKVAQRDPKELARLWKGVRNGAQPECVSDYGIADLPGNTDDVTSSESYHLSDFRGKFDSVHSGGPWYKGVRNACRPKIYTHDEGFYYYFLGFRCCAEPDGKLSDPRTPRAVEKNEDFHKVEQLARFSVAEMKQKLELKAQGKCTCKATDTLCKTMCGILLGDNVQDVDLKADRELEVHHKK
jgi:hypothetical protein